MAMRLTISGTEIGVFDEKKMNMDLAMRLEDETGFTALELLQQVQRLSGRALQALVWITQLQNGNPNPERHMQFQFGDIDLEPLDDEDEAAKAGKGSAPVKAVKAA